MVCSDPGLKDFAKGNYVVFEDDDELEAYMMGFNFYPIDYETIELEIV